MSKDLHMKMDDQLAEAVQAWADQHHVSFTSAVSVLCTLGLTYTGHRWSGADVDACTGEISR